MGGSLCARRSPTVESRQSEPELFKDVRRNKPTYAKKTDSEATTAPLPKRSWASLLKEAPLNQEAQSFEPAGRAGRQHHKSTKQSLKLPPGLEAPVLEPPGLEPQGKLSIDPISADKDDPDWVQYLSKKLQNQGAAKSVAAVPPWRQGCKGTNGNLPRSSKRPNADGLISDLVALGKTTAINNVAKSAGAAPFTSTVIQTEEYMNMLKSKEGNRCKPKTRHARGNLGRGKPGGSFNTDQYPGMPGEVRLSGHGFGLDMSIRPMPEPRFAKKWASALKTNAAFQNTSEGGMRIAQDDLEIEKTLLDHDLSDPVYWSETECIVCKCPSAHPFGRRPRTSKSMVRSYVMQDLSFDLDRAVGMLLLRLQRFTNQHKAFSNVRDAMKFIDRRIVVGYKEVSRRMIKRSSMECLVVAPDIEEDADSGGLDDRMRELLASAYENKIPVIFALSRTRMGQALGKSLQISVLALLNTTGARELMAQCLQLANDCRQAWLSRVAV